MINLKQFFKNSRTGFTLLEVVISLGIFMLFMGAVISSFTSLITVQQKANLSREAISEAKEILSFISIEAKEKRIDYYCTPLNENSTTTRLAINCNTTADATKLVLVSHDGLERLIINLNEDNDTNQKQIVVETQNRTNVLTNWASPTTIPLHSNRLKVEDLMVTISPTEDPYSPDSSPKDLEHPLIYIELKIARNSQKVSSEEPNKEEEFISIRTAIAQRAYNPQEI